ncbi:MAG: hypothetical protein N3A63_00855 [Bacteroidetes bacterium]|nr:hypothetical protein [Bacteroidota bacterium]
MTFEQQKRMVRELERYRSKMTSDEKKLYDMMAKRQKDDEDFDELTCRKLEELHQKYYPKHSKEELLKAWDKLFKK